MNSLKSKLDSVNSEIASLDLEKREKKFFLSLDILKHNLTLLENLNDELGKISVEEINQNEKSKMSLEIMKSIKAVKILINKLETGKKKWEKIGMIN